LADPSEWWAAGQGEFYVTGYNGCKETYTPDEATATVEDVQEPGAAGGPGAEVGATHRARRAVAVPPWFLYGMTAAVVLLLVWRWRRRLLRPFAGLPVFAPPHKPRMRP
jgi:hypothetical protein